MVRVENFLSIFAKNGQSNLVLVLVLVLESKGPYLYHIPSCLTVDYDISAANYVSCTDYKLHMIHFIYPGPIKPKILRTECSLAVCI